MILSELVSQLVKVNGRFIAMKGQKGEEELVEASNALSTCNFKLVEKINLDPSVNFIFIKTKSVDNKYPRNFGQIKKKPL